METKKFSTWGEILTCVRPIISLTDFPERRSDHPGLDEPKYSPARAEMQSHSQQNSGVIWIFWAWLTVFLWILGSAYLMYRTGFLGLIEKQGRYESLETAGNTLSLAYTRLKLDGKIKKYAGQVLQAPAGYELRVWQPPAGAGCRGKGEGPDYLQNFCGSLLPTYDTIEADGQLRFLRKLHNRGRCKVCHMNDPAVIGVIELTAGGGPTAKSGWEYYLGWLWVAGGPVGWSFLFLVMARIRILPVGLSDQLRARSFRPFRKPTVAGKPKYREEDETSDPLWVEVKYTGGHQKAELSQALSGRLGGQFIEEGHYPGRTEYLVYRIGAPNASDLGQIINLIKNDDSCGIILPESLGVAMGTQPQINHYMRTLVGLGVRKLGPGQVLIAENLKKSLKGPAAPKKKGRLVHNNRKIDLLLY